VFPSTNVRLVGLVAVVSGADVDHHRVAFREPSLGRLADRDRIVIPRDNRRCERPLRPERLADSRGQLALGDAAPSVRTGHLERVVRQPSSLSKQADFERALSPAQPRQLGADVDHLELAEPRPYDLPGRHRQPIESGDRDPPGRDAREQLGDQRRGLEARAPLVDPGAPACFLDLPVEVSTQNGCARPWVSSHASPRAGAKFVR
jgi:hypothetical protein